MALPQPKSTAVAPSLTAGSRAMAIIPQTFDDCYRMGKILAACGMVPASYNNNPEACTVAIMQGLEVGLSPIAAVNSIAVINGRPSLWGDGALAVVRASGLLEYMKEWTSDTTAYCEAQRRDEPEPIVRTFSDADAKSAGLLTKKGPWQDYRPRMRQMRARSWVLRDGFADVLKGLHIGEEAQDIPMRDVTPKRVVGRSADGRQTAYAAKSAGIGVIFNEIVSHVRAAPDLQFLGSLRNDYAQELADLPTRWALLLSQEYEDKWKDLGGDPTECPLQAGEDRG